MTEEFLTLNLINLPDIVLEMIFSKLTYDEIAKNRVVRHFFTHFYISSSLQVSLFIVFKIVFFFVLLYNENTYLLSSIHLFNKLLFMVTDKSHFCIYNDFTTKNVT